MLVTTGLWLTGHCEPYTSFISEELLSRVTRLSTLPGSGLKQGWSGFRVLPSSGIHVCSHVSKKGVSPEGLGSDRITCKRHMTRFSLSTNQPISKVWSVVLSGHLVAARWRAGWFILLLIRLWPPSRRSAPHGTAWGRRCRTAELALTQTWLRERRGRNPQC